MGVYLSDTTLRNTSCFSEENFNKLQAIMYEYKVSAGSYLFWEGDTADKLYYIKKGQVKITKSNHEGKEFVLYIFQKGDFFGQLDPFQDSKQGLNASAIEECTMGVVQRSDLEVLLWQHGDLAIDFMKWMGLIHRLTQTKFRDLMLYGKSGALSSTLIRLANTYGEKQWDGSTRIKEKLTNQDLADYIGSARESVNRMLSELKEANVISMQNGHIMLENLNYLKDICHCEDCPASICRI